LTQDDEIKCSSCQALFPDNRDLIKHIASGLCRLEKYQHWIKFLKRFWLPGDKYPRGQDKAPRRSGGTKIQSRDIEVRGKVRVKSEPAEEVPIPSLPEYACAHKVSVYELLFFALSTGRLIFLHVSFHVLLVLRIQSD
jgi:hypothetical protein